MPAPIRYRDRRAVFMDNEHLRVTVLLEGGHIAEVFDKQAGVNPLWTPPWPSIEPSQYDHARHDAYGQGVDAALLGGIMGHNLCLDIFGPPSPEEAAAGLPVHGEASIVQYDVESGREQLVMRARLPLAHLEVERRIELHDRRVRICESVRNLGATDRAVGWTQHVTLGPPFLETGTTEFRSSAGRSRVFESGFGADDYLQASADFVWPHAPRRAGGTEDLRRFTDAAVSSGYTAHVMHPDRLHAFFVACSPEFRLAFGYIWRRDDFPWMGIWEENRSRLEPPWNGVTLARGMEFGVSPFPETRRQMIERGRLFDTPTFRWIPAAGRVSVEYWCVCGTADAVPEALEWPG